MGIVYAKGQVKDDIKMIVSLDTILYGIIDDNKKTIVYEEWKPKTILKNNFLVVGLNMENLSKACNFKYLKLSNDKDIKWRRQFYYRLLILSDILLSIGICFFDSKIRVDSEKVDPLKEMVLYFPKNLFDNKKRASYFQDYWEEYDEFIKKKKEINYFNYMERRLLRQRILIIIDKFFRQFKDPKIAFVNIVDYLMGRYLLELKNPIEKMTNLNINYKLISSMGPNEFIKADKFDGKKEGYVFKKDNLGLGYYKDKDIMKVNKKEVDTNNQKADTNNQKADTNNQKGDKKLEKHLSSLTKKVIATINNTGKRGNIADNIKNLIFDRVINISKHFKSEIKMDRCSLKYLNNDFILFSPGFDSRNFKIIQKKSSKDVSKKIFKAIKETNRLGINLPKKTNLKQKHKCNTCQK